MELPHIELGGFSAILLLSYVVDWVVLLVLAIVGVGLSAVSPRKRAFDVTDPSLSYPLLKETISNSMMVVIGQLVPALVILFVCLFIGLGPQRNGRSKTALIKRKLWELNTGWMGLALALAVAFVITSGTKEVVGKPRPNLIARCNPDMTKKVEAMVGGVGDQVDEGVHLYSWKICRNTGAILDEGFRSFPSGHSSFSFSGLTYLALWLCAKLGVAIPFLTPRSQSTSRYPEDDRSQRSRAAAPPTYLLIFPLLPISLAIYVTSSRYSDYWHHGFDVLSGSLLGIVSAWLGFRWYHLPIQQGGGWAWAPRSPKRAFGKGIGTLGYVDDEVNEHQSKDLEAGGMMGNHFNPPPGARHTRSSNSGEGFEMHDVRLPREFPPSGRGQRSRSSSQ